jgi:hypothetical protein
MSIDPVAESVREVEVQVEAGDGEASEEKKTSSSSVRLLTVLFESRHYT